MGRLRKLFISLPMGAIPGYTLTSEVYSRLSLGVAFVMAVAVYSLLGWIFPPIPRHYVPSNHNNPLTRHFGN